MASYLRTRLVYFDLQMDIWLGTWIGLWQNKISIGTRGALYGIYDHSVI